MMLLPPPGPLLLPESSLGPEDSWGVLFIRGPRSGEMERWIEGEEQEEERRWEMEEKISREEKKRREKIKMKQKEFVKDNKAEMR